MQTDIVNRIPRKLVLSIGQVAKHVLFGMVMMVTIIIALILKGSCMPQPIRKNFPTFNNII